MVESKDELAPNHLRSQDVSVLVGILAQLEGTLMAEMMPEHLATALQRRFVMVGLLDEPASARDLRQAINDLNHRLRYVRGEYDDPPAPTPVPD